MCHLNLCVKKWGSPSSLRRKRPFISLNSSAFIENLSSSEGARARARANHAKNNAQKGCVMQLNGITLSLDQVNSTRWTHIVEWLAPFVKQIAAWSVKEARTEAIQRKNQSSLHIQFDGFYLTRGHHSNNTSAQLPSTIPRMGKLSP